MAGMSLSTRILVALGLGVAAGLVLGDIAAPLEQVGLAFIRLLQMAVLPYVAVSLVAGLGRLTLHDALRLGRRSGLVLLGIAALTVGTVLLTALGYPDWEQASYFSVSALAPRPPAGLLDLYITDNPFAALANAVVPAVVVFSIFLGIALMAVPGKEGLVRGLQTLATALTRVSGIVAHAAPFGVFAIAASAAGTLSVDQFANLQVYFLVYLAAWGVLAFGLLPLLVTSCTSLRYGTVFRETRDALLTAFATGSVFVVLPLLSERIARLLEQAGLGGAEARASVDIIVPTSFSFPSAGTLLSLAFIPYAAWSSDAPLSAAHQFLLATVGPTSLFGSTAIAIPFLLDLFRLPADLFQQFLAADVLASRFGTLLAAMHIVVLGVLGALLLAGQVRWRAPRVWRLVILAAAAPLAAILGMRMLAGAVIDREYLGYQRFIDRDLLYPPVRWTADTVPPPAEPVVAGPGDIVRRGTLRVGYLRDALPFAFVNERGRLVGFDVDMAHHLARELGVRLAFVRVDRDAIAARLEAGQIDMMAGTVITAHRARTVAFSRPYLEVTPSFIVPDHRRDDFATMAGVRSLGELRVGVIDEPYFIAGLRAALPNATVVPLASPRAFFRQRGDTIDALVTAAEVGAAWSLIYPAFTVVVAQPVRARFPVAYAVARDNGELARFISSWVDVTTRDGTVAELYDHWIVGRAPGDRERRWSLARDVLHWIR
jgi:Na+/H+-dicarboxylate symporter/ABC-type amino acid transport substrate-binding protein